MPNKLEEAGISWVILGSQTMPTVMPKIEWVREIVEACDKAGIPVFIKNNLADAFGISNSPCFKRLINKDYNYHTGSHQLRQELPA